MPGPIRSNEGAESLVAAGAKAQQGDLADLESLRCGVDLSDDVVHAAYDHDLSKFAENCAADRQAIEVLGDVLEGSYRPLIVTSWPPLTPERLTTENDVPPADGGGSPRVLEQMAISLIEHGVNVSVVRKSQVHDRNKQDSASRRVQAKNPSTMSAPCLKLIAFGRSG